jgi:hypothetical protein
MDFTKAPVLIECGFGLLLLAMGLFAWRLSSSWRPVRALVFLGLSVFAWFMHAPYAMVLLLAIGIVKGMCVPEVWQFARQSLNLIKPMATSPAFHGVGVTLAGVFLILAPAEIQERKELANSDSLLQSLDAAASIPLPLESISGRTDLGATIELYTAHIDQVADDISWLHEHDYDFRLMRLEGPDDTCNCHGYVFTGAKHWVLGRDVPAILRDNGYTDTQDPQPGDVAVYRDAEGTVAHTGVVRAAGPGIATLVESKWGQYGVYLHPSNQCPYPGIPTYYRTNRKDHSHLIGLVASDPVINP